MENAAEEDWQVLTSLFPEGWDRQAKETGAMERQRGITSAETLLRLFLLHIARGYSLRETSVRAEEAGLATSPTWGCSSGLGGPGECWIRYVPRLLRRTGGRSPPQTCPAAA